MARRAALVALLLVGCAAHAVEPAEGEPTIDASGAVEVAPGMDLQALVTRFPAGTRFTLKAGWHRQQSVVPKSGDTFAGEPGAILDGEGVTAYAFRTGGVPYPRNVTIRGLVIERYAPPLQLGAISAGGHTPAEGSTGWVVEDCEVRNNASAGIRLGARMVVRRSNIHHNGQIGIVGIGDSVVVEGNEIAYNNTSGVDFHWEAGGLKVVSSRGLVVRDNFAHHNAGPGLWTDLSTIDVLYERNRVEDNDAAGIFHEVSYRAIIRDNVVARNGFKDSKWLYGAGILVSASRDVEVSGNTVTDNANGIGAVMQNRGSGDYGPLSLENLFVHDNTVSMTTGRTGLAQDIGDDSYFTTRNNRFARNSYRLASSGRFFEWMDQQLTESEWRAYGLDAAEATRRVR